MYDLNWFSKETMTKWEEINNNDKIWLKCQQFFADVYIARKWYSEAKGQTQDSISEIMDPDLKLYLETMEAKARWDKNKQQEHMQHITKQNAILITLVQK